MTPRELREKAINRFRVGDTVKLKARNDKGSFINSQGTEKAKIIKFYKHYVLCMVKGYRECFTYYDLLAFSGHLNEDKIKQSGHKGITWNKGNKKWYVKIWDGETQAYYGCYERLIDAVEAKENAELYIANK